MATLPAQNTNKVDQLVTEAFFGGYFRYEPQFPKIFKVIPPKQFNAKFSIWAGIGGPTATTTAGTYTGHDITEVGSISVSQQAYKDEISIPKGYAVFEHFGEIAESLVQLGLNYQVERDDVHARIFKNAFISTGGHGITIGGTATPLVSDTNRIGNTGLTFDNELATALSTTQYGAAYQIFTRMVTHDNKSRPMMPALLVHTPNLHETVFQLLRSPGDPTTANRAENAWQGHVSSLEWPILQVNNGGCDDTANDTLAELQDNWFLLADKMLTRFYSMESIAPKMTIIPSSEATGARLYQFDMQIAAVAADWIGVVGSSGTA